MCDMPNPLTCIGWRTCHPKCLMAYNVATCEHPGCPWESDAPTVTVQIEAFITHHQFRHDS